MNPQAVIDITNALVKVQIGKRSVEAATAKLRRSERMQPTAQAVGCL
jgi:hypothetical protein